MIHTNIQRISPWQKPWKISKPAWAELSVVFVTSCLTFPYKGHSFYKRRRWCEAMIFTVSSSRAFVSYLAEKTTSTILSISLSFSTRNWQSLGRKRKLLTTVLTLFFSTRVNKWSELRNVPHNHHFTFAHAKGGKVKFKNIIGRLLATLIKLHVLNVFLSLHVKVKALSSKTPLWKRKACDTINFTTGFNIFTMPLWCLSSKWIDTWRNQINYLLIGEHENGELHLFG